MFRGPRRRLSDPLVAGYVCRHSPCRCKAHEARTWRARMHESRLMPAASDRSLRALFLQRRRGLVVEDAGAHSHGPWAAGLNMRLLRRANGRVRTRSTTGVKGRALRAIFTPPERRSVVQTLTKPSNQYAVPTGTCVGDIPGPYTKR